MLPRANPDVLFKPVSDGAVLLHVADEVYFGLNAVGAKVWEQLPPASSTLEELCQRICAEYPDVSPDGVRSDIEELLNELHQHGLVVTDVREATESDDVAVSSS